MHLRQLALGVGSGLGLALGVGPGLGFLDWRSVTVSAQDLAD